MKILLIFHVDLVKDAADDPLLQESDPRHAQEGKFPVGNDLGPLGSLRVPVLHERTLGERSLSADDLEPVAVGRGAGQLPRGQFRPTRGLKGPFHDDLVTGTAQGLLGEDVRVHPADLSVIFVKSQELPKPILGNRDQSLVRVCWHATHPVRCLICVALRRARAHRRRFSTRIEGIRPSEISIPRILDRSGQSRLHALGVSAFREPAPREEAAPTEENPTPIGPAR